MNTNMRASNEWASRPDDERYWTLEEALQQAEFERQHSAHGLIAANRLRVTAKHGDLLIQSPQTQAKLTNWSFGQLCQRADHAPQEWISKLPATLAAENLNHGLKVAQDEKDVQLLVTAKNGQALTPASLPGLDFTLRAINGAIYERLWDSFFLQGFKDLEDTYGWCVPPARPAPGCKRTRLATEQDVMSGDAMGLSIRIGDEIGPAGIYRGDRDMFIFMVDDDHVIEHNGEKLARGFFFWNSEVGSRSYGAELFLYRSVCGNHIVWGHEKVGEIRFRHVGKDTYNRAKNILEVEVKKYMDSGVGEELRRIDAAKTFKLGADKEEVLDFLIGKRRHVAIPNKVINAAWNLVEEHPEDGDPRTAWGLAQGVTRYSQTLANQDARAAMDAKAGKILEFAF
jgi:hypothetical protein